MHLASCGVISSGRGGMKEVSSLDGALYLKEMSAAAIAESMRFLIENEPERKALAQRGHDYVMRHHRIDDRVAELDALRHKSSSVSNKKKEYGGASETGCAFETFMLDLLASMP